MYKYRIHHLQHEILNICNFTIHFNTYTIDYIKLSKKACFEQRPTKRLVRHSQRVSDTSIVVFRECLEKTTTQRESRLVYINLYFPGKSYTWWVGIAIPTPPASVRRLFAIVIQFCSTWYFIIFQTTSKFFKSGHFKKVARLISHLFGVMWHVLHENHDLEGHLERSAQFIGHV